MMKKREAWFESQLDLDPEKLVFIDETWTSTNMARTRGRAPKGERLRASVPHGHWKTTTFVAGLRLDASKYPDSRAEIDTDVLAVGRVSMFGTVQSV